MSLDENTEEGKLIKRSIDDFYADSSEENLLMVMNVLMESVVWIPCNAVTVDSGEDVRFLPELLQKGEEYFFPVFSCCEEMGEYADKYSKMQKPFVEAIELARNSSPYQVAGIVVNAFTTSFRLSWELLDIIEESANLQ